MNYRKPLIAGLAVLLIFSMSGDVLADISNAAVLFLRIAPGSRAAGMGEAYVALAEDATATHWNPAGLGNHPLSDTWIEGNVPAKYLPIVGFAPLSTGGNHNYLDYDVWAITPAGLIRYDNKRWNTEEVFSTRTDETVEDKVRSYFHIYDDSLTATIVRRIADVNNAGTYDELVALKENILAAVPESFDRYESVVSDLDSLLVCYGLCRVNWDRVKEARERLQDGLKDESLDGTETDRIAVALERSRNRFLPEELRIPYAAMVDGELTDIASTGTLLLVGSTKGLIRFDGNFWEVPQWEDGSAVTGVTTLRKVGDGIIVGTTNGLGVFRGQSVTPLTPPEGAINGNIEAVGGSALTDLYTVADGRMYRYANHSWTPTQPYQVEVGDDIDKIAAKFSLFGSESEIENFIALYKQGYAAMAAAAPADDNAALASEEADTTVSVAMQMLEDKNVTTVSDSAAVDGENGADEAEPVPAEAVIPGIDRPLDPGESIMVPLLASLPAKATDIYVATDDRIWLGTDRGVFYFDADRWVGYGYKAHVVAEGETLESIANLRRGMNDLARPGYIAILREINGLDEGEPDVGTILKVYANPAALPVNSISSTGSKVFVATRGGLLEYSNDSWGRTGLRGMTHENIVGVTTVGDENWVASEKRLVVKGKGHSELSLMHVNWLPELADDLYYEFVSFVTPKEGIGTFGGSVTFISYGNFQETNESGQVVGEFDSYDFAVALSYGVSLTGKLKGGISAKIIYSRLAPQGQGKEQGTGTASGFAVDLGILYNISSRLTFGAALTNLGPKLTYIDAAQSDDLPRNLAMGFSYKLMRSDYIKMLITIEANKLLVGLDDNIGEEAKQTVINGGGEFTYADLFSARAGYIYDQEGDIKTLTLGFGLAPFSWGEFDFAYIPSQDDFSLANTLRISLRFIL